MTKREFGRQNWFILILFGLIGQIAWSVENMYFNLFVFETISPNLDAVTLMVQLSGIAATVTTLVAGTLSDKTGNRRKFISFQIGQKRVPDSGRITSRRRLKIARCAKLNHV